MYRLVVLKMGEGEVVACAPVRVSTWVLVPGRRARIEGCSRGATVLLSG
jgi:hypothetical protein